MEKKQNSVSVNAVEVLILIIMEDTHGEKAIRADVNTLAVLILIIMEDTHGVRRLKRKCLPRLNPYYNGRYSWSWTVSRWLSGSMSVLILIIMEDTHGDGFCTQTFGDVGLNPYYNGRYSWSIRVLSPRPDVGLS